jgi:hypothetical protein
VKTLAAALVFALAAIPVAEAKPLKRCIALHGCVKRHSRPAGARGPGLAMVPVDPFVTPVSPTPPARLGVTAREWSLVLSRPVLPAGPAVVELQNLGQDAHNVRIQRIDGAGASLSLPLAESGTRSSASGPLTAGDYRVFCALPGHAAAGMQATLEVR